MRAATVTRYGVDGLELRVAAPAVPEPDQLIVDTAALSLNPVDLETIQGKNKLMLPLRPPFVPGVDFAGVVSAVGRDVARFEVGDRVAAFTGVPRGGAFAERVAVPARAAAKVPDAVAMEHAAALCLAGLAATEALEALELPAASTVLVHGAAGAVGVLAVQLAITAGHRVVANAHSRDRTRLLELGAERVVCYDEERFDQAGLTVAGAIDTVGGTTLRRSAGVVQPGGAIASLRALPRPALLRGAGFTVPWLLRPVLRLLGTPAGRRRVRLYPIVTRPNGPALAAVLQAAAEGRVAAHVEHTVSFEQLGTVLSELEAKSLRGKCVARVEPKP